MCVTVCTDFLLYQERISGRHPQTSLQCLVEAWLINGQREWWLTKHKMQSSMTGLAEAILSKVYMRRIPWSLIVKGKIKRKVISSEFLMCFEADRQSTLFLDCKQQVEHGSFILDWTWKNSTWNGKTLNLQERRASESGCQQARSWSLASGTVKKWLLWMWYKDGRQFVSYSRCCKSLGSVRNESSLARMWHKTCCNVSMQDHTPVWRLMKSS